MQPLRRYLAPAAAALAWLASNSCGGADPADPTPPQSQGAVVLQTHSIGMYAGEQRSLTAEVRDAHGVLVPGQAVNWSTSNDLKAFVTLDGTLIAVSVGTAYIKASAANALPDSIKVTVLPNPVADVDLLPADSLELETGLTSQLQVLLRDAGGVFLAGRTITFSSADPSKVEITVGGKVTAVRPGRVQVSATSEGVTGSLTVVAFQPSRDYALENAQITQAVQAADNSIPMIFDNAAAVNVLVSATPFKTIPMDVALRVTDAGGNVVYTSMVTTAGTPKNQITFQSANAQFVVPASFVRPGFGWQIVRDPLDRLADDSTQNDVFPRTGPAPIVAVTVPPVKVRFVPIMLTAHTSIAGNVTATNVEDFLLLARSALPLGVVTATIATPISTAQSYGTQSPGGTAAFWGPVLAELDLARSLDTGDPERYWYGVVPQPAGIAAQLSGAGYIPASHQDTGPQSRSAVGLHLTPTAGTPDFGTFTFAYGLALNFGRRPAPCGPNVVSPDPNFPTANGTIGGLGHDVRSWATGRTPTLRLLLPTVTDIMGPCNVNRWVSEYTYRGVLNLRGFAPATLIAGGAAAPIKSIAPISPVTRVIVVRGTVTNDRVVEIAPAFVTDARATAPAPSGAYHLEGRAQDGRVLFARDFEPAAPEGAPDYKHFTFAIPVSAEHEAALATIEVHGPAGRASISRPVSRGGALRVSGGANATRAGGAVSVACADPGARGILVRDATTGDLIGTANGATARIFVGAQTRLDVVCSDGIGSVRTGVVVR